MQSMAHYEQQLLSLHASVLDATQRQKLEDDVRAQLTQLMATDPLRKARYQDLLAATHTH